MAVTARKVDDLERRTRRRFTLQRSLRENSGRLFLRAEIARANEPSLNGRLFTRETLERMILNFERPKLGTREHPSTSSSSCSDSSSCPSHVVLDVRFSSDDRDVVEVILEVLLTSREGKFIAERYRNGNFVGCSIRGWGSEHPIDRKNVDRDATMKGKVLALEEEDEKKKEVVIVDVKDFELITVDVVDEPSHTRAYLEPIGYSLLS